MSKEAMTREEFKELVFRITVDTGYNFNKVEVGFIRSIAQAFSDHENKELKEEIDMANIHILKMNDRDREILHLKAKIQQLQKQLEEKTKEVEGSRLLKAQTLQAILMIRIALIEKDTNYALRLLNQLEQALNSK